MSKLIYVADDWFVMVGKYHCEKCGAVVMQGYNGSDPDYKYCPYCGMKIDAEEHFKSVDEFVKYATAEAKRELAEEKEDETD